MTRKATQYQEILQRLNPGDKIRAFHVAAALEQRHTAKQAADIFFEQVKTGSTFMGRPRILDAVAVRPSWSTPCITGYEIKVERGDFLRDEKWREYLEFVNEFYFAAPPGVIDAAELPAEIGLVQFNPKTKKIRTIRKAAWREIRKDTAFDLLYYLILWRSEERKGYTSREMIERYVSGKIDASYLAHHLQSKIAEELQEAKEAASTAKCVAERYEGDSKQLDLIREQLKTAGLWRGWYPVSELVARLIEERGQALNSNLRSELERMITAVKEVERIIGA